LLAFNSFAIVIGVLRVSAGNGEGLIAIGVQNIRELDIALLGLHISVISFEANRFKR
jgi:hypothetical protein